MKRTLLVILILSAGLLHGAALWAQTTITYQGRLDQAGAPHNGTPNMDFRLYDAATGGTLLGDVTHTGVPVTNGLFQVDLDFGPVFDGSERWLEIRVNGLALEPRQPIRAAPVAIHALGGGDGMDSVSSNSTLAGNGTPSSPLGVASGGLTHQHLQNPAGGRESPYDANIFDVTKSTSSFNSVTLNIPASGYVLLLGSANVFLNHTAGQVQNALVGVGPSPTSMSGRRAVRLPGNAAAGEYVIPVTVQSFQPVSAGNRTFHLNAQDYLGGSATGGIRLSSPQITAIYLPVRH